jgi:hypothetical protein
MVSRRFRGADHLRNLTKTLGGHHEPILAGETSPATRLAGQEGDGKPGALAEGPDGTAFTDQLLAYLTEGASSITGWADFFCEDPL